MKIPLCLVTGFLGSGKTTLLRRIIATHRQRRLVYLVNDFSPRDVDGALLATDDADVVSIPGGSIFCRCLVVGFLGNLKRIPEDFSAPDAPVAGVVIEASGIADPRVVETMLAETRMNERYRLATIVTVVDPKSFYKLLHTLPNIRAQVESADHVIVNKADLCTEAELARTEAQVRKIKPAARVERASHCAVELDLFGKGAPRALDGAYATCADPHYSRMAFTWNAAVKPEALTRVLRDLGDAVFRAKGTVATADGLVYVDASAAGVSCTPQPSGAADPALVCIVQPGTEDRVRAAL